MLLQFCLLSFLAVCVVPRYAYHISVVYECAHEALVPLDMLGVLLNNQHAHLLQTLCCYHSAAVILSHAWRTQHPCMQVGACKGLTVTSKVC